MLEGESTSGSKKIIYKLNFSNFIVLNPLKPSVLFVGHWQTVQTQIRRHRTRRLIRVSSVCLQINQSK